MDTLSTTKDITDVDLEWFSQVDLREYANEYVAIAGKSVVAHGDDPEKVYQEAKGRINTEAIHLFKVPSADIMVLAVA